MPSQANPLISVFRTILLVGVTALLITWAGPPLSAQSAVPPTAVQAAKTPQFAKRLAHPANRSASPKPVPARQASHRAPGQGTYMYENGPINGNIDAWVINFGFIVSDTFTIPTNDGQTTITGMSFAAWLFPGDTLTSAELSITSEPNGGTSYFDQTVSFIQQGSCSVNNYGFNVCTENAAFSGPMLNAGTYWVNLQNALVPSGDPVYWDENSGDGCMSPGCPSLADINSVGSIPSESFTILGETTTTSSPPTCFESGGNLQILDSFTGQQGGFNNGVSLDQAGNLYGTSIYGGDNGAGLAYKLAHFAGWLLDPLFSFFGGNDGGYPTDSILGPNGSLYGGAPGGIPNCGSDGSQYCGLIYNLTPGPTACVTALCRWSENVPYRFTSVIDGSGTIYVTAYDQYGDLYGTTSAGGLFNAGTVFELTPSGGGWTKTTLYTFTGGSDGGAPSQVLLRNDGNLYGIAAGVHFNPGLIFQLTPAGGGRWTESVLYGGGSGDFRPASLVQDSAGNLYGIGSVISQLNQPTALLYTLQKTGSGWDVSENIPYHACQPNDIPFSSMNNVTIDAAGNLYGTGSGGERYSRSSDGSPGGGTECFYNFIFKASYANGNWQYQDLDFLLNTYFSSSGSLAVDTGGNLYGTTWDCGTNSAGTVWQVSP